jgi:predicted 2-oxoglutarate/Fe(II)-dependent dioxygenase YbiX
MHDDMTQRPRKGKAILSDPKKLAEALWDFVDRPNFTNYTKNRKYNKKTVDHEYLMQDQTQTTIAAVTKIMRNTACAPAVWMQALKLINEDS